MRIILTLAVILAAPALPGMGHAQDSVLDRAAGLYGALAFGSDNTCDKNPHRLSFMTRPNHAFFDWEKPITGLMGEPTLRATYDVLAIDENSITMRLEGELRLTDDGVPLVWVLRLTEKPQGYCWGRTDWPAAACVHPHVRCADAPPTS